MYMGTLGIKGHLHYKNLVFLAAYSTKIGL